MRSLNETKLIGNLGKDPEVRYTGKGIAVASFTIATNSTWTNAEGEKQEQTEWHNIVVWRKLAEACGEWLRKGSKVYLCGRLTYRKYDDKEGITRYVTEIHADDVIFLDKKPVEEAVAP